MRPTPAAASAIVAKYNHSSLNVSVLSYFFAAEWSQSSLWLKAITLEKTQGNWSLYQLYITERLFAAVGSYSLLGNLFYLQRQLILDKFLPRVCCDRINWTAAAAAATFSIYFQVMDYSMGEWRPLSYYDHPHVETVGGEAGPLILVGHNSGPQLLPCYTRYCQMIFTFHKKRSRRRVWKRF